MAHVFKPGDMAIVITCINCPEAVGLYCIVESHPYEMGLPTRYITIVDITVGHPTLKFANITCLKYVPPEEWPESKYKQRELVRVEGAPHEHDQHRQGHPEKRREPATTE